MAFEILDSYYQENPSRVYQEALKKTLPNLQEETASVIASINVEPCSFKAASTRFAEVSHRLDSVGLGHDSFGNNTDKVSNVSEYAFACLLNNMQMSSGSIAISIPC